MSRILLPLLLSAAAFASAWWAGSKPPASTPDRQESPSVAPGSPPPPPAANLSGLAKRSAQLARTENPDWRSIAGLITEPGMDSSEIVRLAKLWAEQDPAGIWAWLSQGGKDRLSKNLDVSNIVFSAWFRIDAAAAFAAFRGLDKNEQLIPAAGLLQHLTGSDTALRAKILPHLDELVAAAGSFPSLSSKPAESVAILMSLPPGKGRDALLESVGKSWVTSDWKAATGWAATLTEPMKSRLLADMAQTAFRIIPPEMKASSRPLSHGEAECFDWAKQWFASEAPPEAKRQLSASFVRKLASTDPAAALEWAQDNLSARPLTQAMGTILKEQAKKDPAAARGLVEGLPPGGMKDRVAFEIAGKPSPETVDWLRREVTNDPNYQWSRLASDWAFTDPAAFRSYLETTRDPPERFVRGGLSNLVKKDGPGTMEWAMRTQPAGTVSQALQSWTTEDAPAAVDWVLQRPPGPARDKAMEDARKSLGYSQLSSSERQALKSRLEKP